MTYDDESAIRRVIFDYAWAIDTKDWAALRACFTEPCDLSYGGEESLPHPHATGGDVAFTSRDDFVTYVASTHEAIHSFHMMGATAIDLESPERARARTYGRLVLAPPASVAGGRYESAGVYADVLVKEGGVWRLTERHYTRMWADGEAAVLRRGRG